MMIVEAGPGDAPEILAVQKEAFRSDVERYRDPDIPPMLQTVEDTVRELTLMRCWKAVEHDRILGSVRARETDGVAEIFKLIVRPECWRRGLGTQLLAAAENAFPQAHIFRLFTGGLNYDNQRFYLRRGYNIIGRRQITPTVFLFDLEKPGPTPRPAGVAAEEVLIVPAGPEDAAAILELQRLAFYQEAVLHDDLQMQPQRQTLEETAAELTTMRCWKAVCAGQVVGSVRIRRAADGAGEIFKLMVHPLWWGKGLGGRLLRTAEGAFPGLRKIRLYTAERNTVNVNFYVKHGYRLVGRHPVSPTLMMVDLQKDFLPQNEHPIN